METERLNAQIGQYAGLVQRLQGLMWRIAERGTRQGTGQEFSINDFGTIASAYARVWADLVTRPADLVAFQQEALLRTTAAWLAAWSGGAAPEVADRRYRDRLWAEDPLGRAMRDAHLALEQAVDGFLDQLPRDSKDQLRVSFYTRQLLSALAPGNFLALNPAARKRFLETEGQSLLDGLENLLDDLERGEGRLEISTNDQTAYVIGRDLATTPGKVVYQNELMQLIQYEPLTETQRKRPLLMVPAWINKFYIFDMRARNSLVRYMLARGHSVFVISWVNPTEAHAKKSFEHYMTDGPLAALDAIEAATGEHKINILGFCIGGILVTATLAYLAARGDDRIAAATTLATMIDFTDVGEIGVFIDNDRVAALRAHMKDKGYLENHHLQDMFSMIRENDLVWSFHVMNYLMGRQPPAFDLLYWNSDSTRLPAAMLLWYLEKIYIENGLRRPDALTLNGTGIDVGRIKVPFFVLATREDHIAPWRSVYPTARLLGGDVTFVLGASGHIAGVINPPAADGRSGGKYGYWTRPDYPANPEDWLEGATFAEGSWWPTWAGWLEARDRARRVPARVPGDRGLAVIEDAPGSYVLAR